MDNVITYVAPKNKTMAQNRGKKIEELREASKIPLEHMFNSHNNCSSEWCFNTRASEEGKIYNERDDEFRCKQNDNQL